MLNDYNLVVKEGNEEKERYREYGEPASQRKMNECMFKRIKEVNNNFPQYSFFAFMLYGALLMFCIPSPSISLTLFL